MILNWKKFGKEQLYYIYRVYGYLVGGNFYCSFKSCKLVFLNKLVRHNAIEFNLFFCTGWTVQTTHGLFFKQLNGKKAKTVRFNWIFN